MKLGIAVLSCAMSLLAAGRKDDVDRLTMPLLASDLKGVVIGLVENGRTEVFTYGGVERAAIFEIGSVTKTFTGLALARTVEAGAMKLDDPVRKFLPPEALTPPVAGIREITLGDLATQSSGLPRLPTNLNIKLFSNPYVDYDSARLYAYLKERGLARPADAAYLYSNLGFGLLGHVLARQHHGSYEKLIADLITGPLEMHDTRVQLDPAARPRMAQGHTQTGVPVPPWDFDALAGAGAIRSTVDDMLRYVQAQIEPPATLAAAIRNSQVVRASTGAGGGGIALAWHTLGDRETLWHNGATAGYHSWVSFSTASHTGVVVLSNSQSAKVDQLGGALQKLVKPLTQCRWNSWMFP